MSHACRLCVCKQDGQCRLWNQCFLQGRGMSGRSMAGEGVFELVLSFSIQGVCVSEAALRDIRLV